MNADPVLVSAEELAGHLLGRQQVLLGLDFDGTLVPIAPTPWEAVPDGDLLGLLRGLAASPVFCVAVISGRKLEELEEMLPVPGLWLAGVHGAVWKEPDGERYEVEGLDEVRSVLRRLAGACRELLAGRNGFILEDKEISLALHYRLAEPEEARAVRQEFEAMVAKLGGGKLEILGGKKVVEARVRGTGKGVMLRRLLAVAPDFLPVYIGDDITDEDAFAALASHPGAVTVLVSAYPRPSAARFRLAGQCEVIDFLRKLSKGSAHG